MRDLKFVYVGGGGGYGEKSKIETIHHLSNSN